MKFVRCAAVLCLGLASGCSVTQLDPPADSAVRIELADTVGGASADVVVGDGQAFEVPSLGLNFELALSFELAADDELEFLARSGSPRSIFSIQGDTPEVIDYSARPGETTTAVSLDGVDAVVVTNAALEGLPEGISANELLVSNGSQSFSLIMSADDASLAKLWARFVLTAELT